MKKDEINGEMFSYQVWKSGKKVKLCSSLEEAENVKEKRKGDMIEWVCKKI